MLVPMIFRRGLNSGHCVRSSTDGRTKIHRRKRKSPTKDITPDEQTAVRNLKTHMLRTVQDEKCKHKESGNDNDNPKGLFGLSGKDADNQPNHCAGPSGKTGADIPFPRRRSAGNRNGCQHVLLYSDSAISSPRLPGTWNCIELSNLMDFVAAGKSRLNRLQNVKSSSRN